MNKFFSSNPFPLPVRIMGLFLPFERHALQKEEEKSLSEKEEASPSLPAGEPIPFTSKLCLFGKSPACLILQCPLGRMKRRDGRASFPPFCFSTGLPL